MRGIFHGGVTRHQEMGVWSAEQGVPQAVRGRAVSQTGWGSRAQLQQADYFICASERQRDFWIGTLHTAGRVTM